MAQTRGSISQLYDNTDRRIYVQLNTSLKKLPAGWREVFKVESSERQTEIAMNIVGFGDVPEKPEGEPYTTDLMRPGHEKRVSHTELGLGFEVTETAMEDDLYGQIDKKGMWLTFAADYVLNKRAWNIFNNAFTTETTADGLSIFNTAHVLAGGSGGTFRNRPTAEVDLSWTTLRDAITDLETETKHDSGQLAASVQNLKLIVHPSNEMLADRVLNSNGLPGSADNDRNSIKSRRDISIVVSKLLTDPDAWFLVAADSNMHGFRSYERVSLQQGEPMTDARTRNRLYTIRGRYSWYGLYPQNSWGTSGA